MGRYLILNTLLLGLIGIASSQTLVTTGRPIFPKNANEGCTPGAKVTDACPPRMECFTDKNYPNGGRCDCNPLWFKIPTKLPFDNSEWDNGFTTSDCKTHYLSAVLVGLFFVINITMTVSFLYTNATVIRELISKKALKWQGATSHGLFFLLWAAVGVLCVDIIYLMNTWGADPQEFWYASRTPILTFGLMPPNVIVDFEIGVTWIDLYDRTNKMSKSTSRALKALRVFLRLIAFAMSFGFVLFVAFGGILDLLISALMPSVVGMLFVAIGGRLIVSTLCPDKNDISNQNWAVANSIRRAVRNAVMAKFFEIVSLIAMGFTGRHAQLGYCYGWFNALFFFSYILRMWAWLRYLIYSFRKNLKRFEKDEDDAQMYRGISSLLASSFKSSRFGSALHMRSSVKSETATLG